MSFPTLHPENKAINLLDSALTLFPHLNTELREWVRKLITTIARPVPTPDGIRTLADNPDSSSINLEHETYLLANALCTYRERVYPNGIADPIDPHNNARDDLESAMSRFEERLARSKPRIELENMPDAGDDAENEEDARNDSGA